MRPWTGYYEQDGVQYPMIFQDFDYSPEEGKMRAEGNDSAGNWTMQGTIVNHKFRARKNYPTWVIYYSGDCNPTKKTIKGHWGFHEGESVEKFRLNM